MSILKNTFRKALKSSVQNAMYSKKVSKKNWKLNAGNIIWNKPEPVQFLDPAHFGDLELFKVPPLDTIRLEFENSEVLKNASKEIQKIFSLHYLPKMYYYKIYEREMLNKVSKHVNDTKSVEAKIAIYTAKTRFYKYCCDLERTNSVYISNLNMFQAKRLKFLKILRMQDYKKFEWILEELKIVYRPYAERKKITRKNSVRALATIRAKTEIEIKQAELKKKFDSQKISFLEKKIEKLNWIRDTEKENNLPSTVSDDDITKLVNELEEIKISISEKLKRDYKRKIDPNSLEIYDEKLLLEKEQGKI